MSNWQHIAPILERILAAVPAPYQPPPQPRAQWQRLKAGQRLRRRSDNLELTVLSCDSEGVTLGADDHTELRLTSPEWETEYERVRTRPKLHTKGRPKLG